MGPFELARPAEQQPVLHAGTQHHLQTRGQCHTRRAVFQLEGVLQLCFVDTLAAQKADQHPHAERLAEQQRIPETGGVGDGLVGGGHAFGDAGGAELGECEDDQRGHPQRQVVRRLRYRPLPQLDALGEAVVERPHRTEQAERHRAQRPRLQLGDDLLEQAAGPRGVARFEIVAGQSDSPFGGVPAEAYRQVE
jgi:hypothetical protein